GVPREIETHRVVVQLDRTRDRVAVAVEGRRLADQRRADAVLDRQLCVDRRAADRYGRGTVHADGPVDGGAARERLTLVTAAYGAVDHRSRAEAERIAGSARLRTVDLAGLTFRTRDEEADVV